jgi:hypothetical protein
MLYETTQHQLGIFELIVILMDLNICPLQRRQICVVLKSAQIRGRGSFLVPFPVARYGGGQCFSRAMQPGFYCT